MKPDEELDLVSFRYDYRNWREDSSILGKCIPKAEINEIT